MCGIVGYASASFRRNPPSLKSMKDSLTHRGPDGAGEWYSSDGCVGLGHRRLAIIDLSAAAQQPMEDNTGRYVIVLNGEIYNYRELRDELQRAGHIFRSKSDTEVLLEAYKEWKSECLGHVTGAFAFGIFDVYSRELFIARDRAGEKPLFYVELDDRFIFASELKALLSDPSVSRALDLGAFDYYLAYGYVSGDQAILKNVRKLPPGHAMCYSLDRRQLHIWPYWDLPTKQFWAGVSEEDLLEELESLLIASVQRQLVADVPVGILLSGGLDSSLITAIAASVSDQRIKTFTVAFPGHGSFDEGPHARIVAKHFGTDHTEMIAEPASISLLPELARQYDEPIADHSIVPTSMLAGLVRQSVTVALGGDGGDELFGGYPHYSSLQRIEKLRNHTPASIRKLCSMLASDVFPVGTRWRNHAIALEHGAVSSIAAVNLYFDKNFRRKLLAPLYGAGYSPSISPEVRKAELFDDALSTFQNAARMDFLTTMVDGYLVKSDRASMLHSLELRAPFLDHSLVGFAFGRVPDTLRATVDGRKILLKKLAKRLLPKEFDINRKQGFTLPLGSWFKGEWGSFMTDILMEADRTIFDRKIIEKLIRWQRKGLGNANRLFCLTMFELWRREYKITL